MLKNVLQQCLGSSLAVLKSLLRGTLILIVKSFSGMKTKVLIRFYILETKDLVQFLPNLDIALLSNQLRVQYFDSLRSFVAPME